MEMPWDRRLRIMAEQEQAAEKAKQEREAAATASHLWTQAIGALQRSNPAPSPFPMPTCPVLIDLPRHGAMNVRSATLPNGET